MRESSIKKSLIKVGSGNINNSNYGFKAKGLDYAAYKNIIVPKGYLLPHEIWTQIKHKKEEKRNLIIEIQTVLTKPSIAIRSAFSTEDQKDSSLAGVFETVLSIDRNNPDQIMNGLEKVVKSARNYKDNSHQDILIMEMVEAKYSGVAFTESEYEDDQINWTEGIASKLVSGEITGKQITIPKLKSYDFFVKNSKNVKCECSFQSFIIYNFYFSINSSINTGNYIANRTY